MSEAWLVHLQLRLFYVITTNEVYEVEHPQPPLCCCAMHMLPLSAYHYAVLQGHTGCRPLCHHAVHSAVFFNLQSCVPHVHTGKPADVAVIPTLSLLRESLRSYMIRIHVLLCLASGTRHYLPHSS